MSAELWRKVKTFVGVPVEDEEMLDISPAHINPHVATYPDSEDKLRTRRSNKTDKNGLSNIIGLNAALSQSEMLIVEPKSFDEALDIVESLRMRKAVIINLTDLDGEQAQRLIDFVAGATHALDGNQERIGDGIFLFSPSNVVINALGVEQQPWMNRDARDLFWRVK